MYILLRNDWQAVVTVTLSKLTHTEVASSPVLVRDWQLFSFSFFYFWQNKTRIHCSRATRLQGQVVDILTSSRFLAYCSWSKRYWWKLVIVEYLDSLFGYMRWDWISGKWEVKISWIETLWVLTQSFPSGVQISVTKLMMTIAITRCRRWQLF